MDADIDEFFDYPFSDSVGLREFLGYLNQHRYTAVVTQLLDMFSDQPLAHLTSKKDESLKAVYGYYDISNLTTTSYDRAELASGYGSRNAIANQNTSLVFGGIRKTLYGKEWLTNCLLTKHSLFVPGSDIDLFPHVHFVNNARLADISCVMLHYKLTSNALEVALQNKKSFVGLGKGYGDFAEFLMSNPDYEIKKSTAVRYLNAQRLAVDGFLFTSEEYQEYVRSTPNCMTSA